MVAHLGDLVSLQLEATIHGTPITPWCGALAPVPSPLSLIQNHLLFACRLRQPSPSNPARPPHSTTAASQRLPSSPVGWPTAWGRPGCLHMSHEVAPRHDPSLKRFSKKTGVSRPAHFCSDERVWRVHLRKQPMRAHVSVQCLLGPARGEIEFVFTFLYTSNHFLRIKNSKIHNITNFNIL
jgi:hypothetical protein